MSTRRFSVNTPARWVAVVAVAALALAALALAWLAFAHVRTAPEKREVAPVPTFSQPPQTPPTSASPPSTVAPPGAAVDLTAERFLAAGTDVLWRGVAGKCGGVRPVLERSADAGDTWTDVTPLYRGIGQLSAVDAFAATEAEIVASIGAGCEVQALRTFTQGRFWESYPEALRAARYVDPADAAQVELVSASVPAPCANAQGMRAAGETAALVCDGSAYVLVDAAWSPLPAKKVAAVAVDEGAVVVAHAAEGCPGLAITRYDGAAKQTAGQDGGQALGCARVSDAAAPAAVVVSRGEVLVWSGDDDLVTAR